MENLKNGYQTFLNFMLMRVIDMISLIKNNLDPLSHKFSVIEF